jgi:hypothetical protein
MHDLCRILESRPTRKPKTLVAAMINVAVHGLYASTINEGFRLNEWRDQDLVALQQQLSEVDLLSEVPSALNCEVASINRTLETTPPSELATLFYAAGSTRKPPLYSRLFWASIPRGWIDQNLVLHARHMIATSECIDTASQSVFPERATATLKKISRAFP